MSWVKERGWVIWKKMGTEKTHMHKKRQHDPCPHFSAKCIHRLDMG